MVDALYTWTPKLAAELGKYRGQLVDVNSDLQQNGLQTYVTMNRGTAKRLGFEPNQIDSALRCLRPAHRVGHFQPVPPILFMSGRENIVITSIFDQIFNVRLKFCDQNTVI